MTTLTSAILLTAPAPLELVAAGRAADTAGARTVFRNYRERRARRPPCAARTPTWRCSPAT